jgi:hypothetical protein
MAVKIRANAVQAVLLEKSCEKDCEKCRENVCVLMLCILKAGLGEDRRMGVQGVQALQAG